MKKIFGLFAIMFLVLVAFAFSGVAMASVSGGAPASMACLAGCDEVAAVTAVIKDDTMIKYDLPGINEKGSVIAPVACNGKDHRHYVGMASVIIGGGAVFGTDTKAGTVAGRDANISGNYLPDIV